MAEYLVPDDQATVAPSGVKFTHRQIAAVVDDFYFRVQQDPDLSIPFVSVNDWPEHIKRLTHFWWVRFGGTPYMDAQYDPVGKHFSGGFTGELLQVWLRLFDETLKRHLDSTQHALWKSLSERMGGSLSLRNEAMHRASKLT